MAVAYAGQIVLGAIAGELLKAILEVKDKAANFKDDLERLSSTLDKVIPTIAEIERLDAELTDRQRTDIKELTDQLWGGKELVRKCSKISKKSKISPLVVIKKYRCSKKLLKLDETIIRFFQLDAQADMWHDTKKLLLEVKQLSQNFDRLSLGRDGGSGNNFRIGSMGSCAVPDFPDHVVGFDVPLIELKRELFREDVTVLGLCAPGGCGKTTLASMLCQDQQVKERFKENIFFVTISSSPNLKLVIQRLVGQMAYDVPEFLDDEDAVKQFRYLLKQREEKSEPTLLVLDDVWTESVVLNLLFRTKGLKMLVTSRTRFQTFDANYNLKMLGHQDAKTLFRHEAFPQNGNEIYVPDEDLLDKIVRGCKGFPLAVVVIAHSVRFQRAREWRSTERKLSTVCFNFDSHKDLLDRLATSLYFLDHTVRECFLDLGSFPEDHRIPASAVVDIWVELYGLDEDDAYVNLLELSNKSLIKLVESTRKGAGDIDGSLNDLFIIQHDLLRDLAIHQSRQQGKGKRLIMDKREESIPSSWVGKDHQDLSAQLVSIHTDEMHLTSWCDMQLPAVEVLILNLLGKYTLPPLMKKMGKLKVLIITNHERSHAKLSDLSTLGHLPHLKRLRLEKVSIPSFDEITMPLKNLCKMSLINCEVGQALRNYTVKIAKMFPNLIEIDIDYCNDLVELPPGICDVAHLQKLSITNCHHLSTLPTGIELMTNLKELRLHACTEMVALPDSIRGLQKLRFLDISDCLNMERLPEGIGELRGLEKLDMRWCSRVRELPNSFMALEHLRNVICDEGTASLWEPFDLPELEITVRKDNIDLNWLGIDLMSYNFY